METERAGRLRRGLAAACRRRGAVAAAVLAAAGALVLVLALGGSGDGAASSPSSSVTTGTVARRTLAERLTSTGTIGYAGETTVLARLAGTVTALPAIGDVIRRGGRLYAIAGEPVLLMYGAMPAYRTLAEGVGDGKDVAQLERSLAALGYEPGTVDEEFTYATAAAVAAWQEDLGLEVTGEVELGRVAFLRGPQRVTTLEATLGEALASGRSSSSSEMVAWHPEAEALAEAEEPSEVTQQAAEERERERREREKERELEKREREKEKEKVEEEESVGDEAESEPSSIPVLRTSSTRRVVSVELEANQQSIAHRGQQVEVILPGGVEVTGKVTGLTAVEASGGAGGPEEEREAGAEATISVTGKRRIPALDGVSVSVRFTQRVRKRVLSVPLTALIAISGERFAVYLRGAGARRQIVVTPGLAADGYVEVEGKGLRAGMTVETGE